MENHLPLACRGHGPVLYQLFALWGTKVLVCDTAVTRKAVRDYDTWYVCSLVVWLAMCFLGFVKQPICRIFLVYYGNWFRNSCLEKTLIVYEYTFIEMCIGFKSPFWNEIPVGMYPEFFKVCPEFLRHKMTLVSPKSLRRNGIPFNKVCCCVFCRNLPIIGHCFYVLYVTRDILFASPVISPRAQMSRARCMNICQQASNSNWLRVCHVTLYKLNSFYDRVHRWCNGTENSW